MFHVALKVGVYLIVWSLKLRRLPLWQPQAQIIVSHPGFLKLNRPDETQI